MESFSFLLVTLLFGSGSFLTMERDEAAGHTNLATACVLPKACPMIGYEDWYKVGSRCVKYFGSPLNFTSAEFSCRNKASGGHLVSVHNSKANGDLLCIVIKLNPHNLRIWIGGFVFFQFSCMKKHSGAHLVSVHSSKENDYLLCIVKKFNSNNLRIWLGGFELFETGTFIWIDGSIWVYENWACGQPSHIYTNKEVCLEMNWKEAGRWNDKSCFVKKNYICTFKQKAILEVDGAFYLAIIP